MLGYLQGHSCADITFAVLQVSCYIFCTKRSHELAVERIGRYLKGTIEEGLILKPKRVTDKFKIDIYIDAAFANKEQTLTLSNLVLVSLLKLWVVP